MLLIQHGHPCYLNSEIKQNLRLQVADNFEIISYYNLIGDLQMYNQNLIRNAKQI